APPSPRDPQGTWALPLAAPDRGRRQLGDCLYRRQAFTADYEGLERRCCTSRLDGQAGDRPSRGRRLAGLVRLRAAAAEGEAGGRLFNDAHLAAARTERRFVPLASVPLQDGARAAAVLKAAVAAGFNGAMISTLPRGIGSVLDAADLDPFWAAA